MINIPLGQLMHRHADGHYAPMTEHRADDHDPERELVRGELRGARVFTCSRCAEEIVVQPANETKRDASR